MYFRELSTLTREHPWAKREIKALDDYLASAPADTAEAISIPLVVKAIEGDPGVVKRLLDRSAELGLLRRRYRVVCPKDRADIGEFRTLGEIPQEIECEFCDEKHEVSDNDIEEIFALNREPVAVRGPAASKGSSGEERLRAWWDIRRALKSMGDWIALTAIGGFIAGVVVVLAFLGVTLL